MASNPTYSGRNHGAQSRDAQARSRQARRTGDVVQNPQASVARGTSSASSAVQSAEPQRQNALPRLQSATQSNPSSLPGQFGQLTLAHQRTPQPTSTLETPPGPLPSSGSPPSSSGRPPLDHRDLSSQTRWVIRIGPITIIIKFSYGPDDITGKELLANGIRVSHMIAFEGAERLPWDGIFKQRARKFFCVGRIFAVPCADMGDAENRARALNSTTKVYLFVVIQEAGEGERFCSGIWIMSTADIRVDPRSGLLLDMHSAMYVDVPVRCSVPHIDDCLSSIKVESSATDASILRNSSIKYDQVCSIAFNAPVYDMGKVHEESLDRLKCNFRDAWAHRRGPVAQRTPVASSYSEASNGDTRRDSGLGSSGTDATNRGRTNNTGAGSGNNRDPRASAGLTATSPNNATTSGYGAITIEQMQVLLKRYQDYARTNNLAMPGTNIKAQKLQELASNAQTREQYLQAIKTQWKVEMEGSDESEDGDESDDDDEED